MEKVIGMAVGVLIFIVVIALAIGVREGGFSLGSSGSGFGGGIFGASGVGTMSQNNQVRIVDEIPNQKDHFTIIDATLVGKELVVEVNYAACDNHVFNVYSTAGQGFMKSNPVQTNLYFVHDAIEDRCDAAFKTDVYRFDLQPLIDEYIRAYGREDRIIMNIQNFGSVIYTP